MNTGFLGSAVATVLTVYGIETCIIEIQFMHFSKVATVLTVYGIETLLSGATVSNKEVSCNSTYRLRY